MSKEQSPLTIDHTISRAADYTARAFSGNASEQDRLSLNLWLPESDEHREEYQGVLDVWTLVGGLSDRVNEMEQIAKPGGQKWRGIAPWALAACLLLGITVFFVAPGPDHLKGAQPSYSYMTSTGERKEIALEDGTRITLNTNSRVLVDFTHQKRRLVLERGEVLLNVAKDAGRPFVVSAGSRAITVLGTTFNVHKVGFDLHIGVVEGAVAVHHSELPISSGTDMAALLPEESVPPGGSVDAYQISAGTRATFSGIFATDTSQVRVAKIEQLNKFPYWHRGTLLFNNQPLYEVVRSLNRYTQKKVFIESAEIMELRISGMFQIDQIESNLHKLESLFPIQVTTYEDRLVLTKK